VTEEILVRSQIWDREVKVRIQLDNVHTNHVTRHLELISSVSDGPGHPASSPGVGKKMLWFGFRLVQKPNAVLLKGQTPTRTPQLPGCAEIG
jgi:hypothetical protein